MHWLLIFLEKPWINKTKYSYTTLVFSIDCMMLFNSVWSKQPSIFSIVLYIFSFLPPQITVDIKRRLRNMSIFNVNLHDRIYISLFWQGKSFSNIKKMNTNALLILQMEFKDQWYQLVGFFHVFFFNFIVIAFILRSQKLIKTKLLT